MEALTDVHPGPTFNVRIFGTIRVTKDTIIEPINTIIESMLVITGSITVVIIGSTMVIVIGSTMVEIIGSIMVIIIGSIIETLAVRATTGEISEAIFHQEIIKNLAEIINVKN